MTADKQESDGVPGQRIAGRALCRRHWPTKHIHLISGLFTIAALLSAGCDKKVETAAAATDVDVVEVIQRDVPIKREWVGTLDGLVNAQIHAQVTGYLSKQEYVNGDFVRKGTPLFQIDPRPFQASLDQAKASLGQAEGTLKQSESALETAKANQQQAEAQYGKTQIDVTRYTPLAKEKAISQQELDNAVQANLGAKAQVASMKASVDTATAAIGTAKASVLAAQAAVEAAKLNLGFTSITSPVDGVAGIANAQVGDLVAPGSSVLTTVSTVNPILVNFTPSEEQYLNVARDLGGSPGTNDEALKKLDFQLLLADGSQYPRPGHIYAINRQVNATTGTILVQTEFPNPGNVLRPGGFARINTVARTQHGALLVPQRAVTDLQGTYLVAVVDSDNKVIIRPVKVGDRFGSMWIIDEGLQRGDRVVAEGTQKVREGMQVNPKPYVAAPGTVETAVR